MSDVNERLAQQHEAYTLCARRAVHLTAGEIGALRYLATALGVYSHAERDERRLCALLSDYFARNPAMFAVMNEDTRGALLTALPADQAARLAASSSRGRDKRKFAARLQAEPADVDAMSDDMAAVWIADKRRR